MNETLRTRIALGFVLIKSEVAPWFRIQKMFLFYHMYGIIGLAVIVGIISVQIMPTAQNQ